MRSRCLVESDPDVVDMLHFFKHSFTLFLKNYSFFVSYSMHFCC